MTIDKNRIIIHKRTRFKPFNVSEFIPAKDLINDLLKDEGVLIFEHQKKYYGLMTKQMTYHHVANGLIDGQAFLISF